MDYIGFWRNSAANRHLSMSRLLQLLQVRMKRMDIASVLLVGCNVDNSVIYANSIGHHDCAMEGQLFAYESHVAIIGLANPQLAAPAEHVGAAVDLGVHPISFCINALVKLGHSQTWRQ